MLGKLNSYGMVLYLTFESNVIFFISVTAKDPKKTKRERISVHGFYRIGKVIGDGNFAVVRECKNRWVTLGLLYTHELFW